MGLIIINSDIFWWHVEDLKSDLRRDLVKRDLDNQHKHMLLKNLMYQLGIINLRVEFLNLRGRLIGLLWLLKRKKHLFRL